MGLVQTVDVLSLSLAQPRQISSHQRQDSFLEATLDRSIGGCR